VNCEIVKQNYPEYTEVKIPYRRESLFDSLSHEENGFCDNKWKDKATRWNQLRFVNEVSLNPKLTKHDGLSNLKYYEYSAVQKNKITRVNIRL
jgi:hypothetical protein